jgi:hypothetical protein
VTERPTASDVAVTTGAAVAGAALGLVMAGPPGALASAALAPLLQAVWERRRANVDLFEQFLVDLSGLSPEQIAVWAQDHEGRSHLLMAACDAALAARAQNKIRALARVVALGIESEDRIDYAAIVVDAISQLDPPHVQVLRAIVHDMDIRPEPAPTSDHVGADAWAASQLVVHLPHLATAIGPIGNVLVRTGMLGQGPFWVTNDDTQYFVTPFGLDCLAFLEGPGVDAYVEGADAMPE